MKLSKILFLMLGIFLAFSFIGCDDFSLTEILDGVTLTIENRTDNDYSVSIEGVNGIYHLTACGTARDTIEFQIPCGYNIIKLIPDTRILGRYFDRPYTWIISGRGGIR